ncbi:MAG: precorrin-6A/cobalt-precorrin-6A reductase, partial [Clostridiales bacterium]|nr:precorrin-6A/cobalt-precorrin-6A reductase [Clostridiales bacterium]
MSGRTDGNGAVLILGGTSEGRELAEYAEWRRIPALVTVVSEYGEKLLCQSMPGERSATAPVVGTDFCVRVYRGRLDEEAMERLLKAESPEFVLDATHPYASQVTALAKKVCGRLAIPCFRVLRQSERPECANLHEVDSAEEAAAFLK